MTIEDKILLQTFSLGFFSSLSSQKSPKTVQISINLVDTNQRSLNERSKQAQEITTARMKQKEQIKKHSINFSSWNLIQVLDTKGCDKKFY